MMRASRERIGPRPIIFIPGLDNSGPTHWQTHWQRSMSTSERLQQKDWAQPTLEDWVAALVKAVTQQPGAVLVAHGLGCSLVAHIAGFAQGRRVAGALLVAPIDLDQIPLPDQRLIGFPSTPRHRLPFPSTVVASRTDTLAAIDWSQLIAGDWGSRFVDIGKAGHINGASGHGSWPEGRGLLVELMGRMGSVARAISQEA